MQQRMATKQREKIKRTTTWNRKATDRKQWKTLVEGYILQ